MKNFADKGSGIQNRSAAETSVGTRKTEGQEQVVNNTPMAVFQRKLKNIVDNGSRKNLSGATASPVAQLNPTDDKRPFVELPTGVKEKDTRVKTGLLGEALEADDKVRNKKIEKNRPPSREAKYLFHATTYQNLITILEKGLDPRKGGSDVGASALASGQLKEDSLKGSSGHVHGATQSEVALHYANKFDSRENVNPTREGAKFAVMLRFKVGDKDDWTEDTEDSRGNYKTQENIPPDQIEYLEAGSGWQPLQRIDTTVLKSLEADKSLVPVSEVRDETPKEQPSKGVVAEKNVSNVKWSPDGKYSSY